MALFDFLKRKSKREKEKRVIAKEKNMPAREKQIAKESRRESRRVTSERTLVDIIRPHITERSRQMSQQGVYMFRVSEKATKRTIAQAIEALYRVAVDKVRVMRIPSKPRQRRGLTRGTKKGYKKAAVMVRAGEHIELFS
jgi:large subunit ribosomal protein L23